MAEDEEELRLRQAALQNAEVVRRARRQAEEELRRQSEWSKTTLACIGEGVITADPEGRVTFVNPVAQRLTGWTQDEALGRQLDEMLRLVAEGTGMPVASPVQRALAGGATPERTGPVPLIARDGSARPVEITAAPIRSEGGTLLGCVAIVRDVSERRQMERDLAELIARERAARADAERASRLKEEFLATLSHELRTPLNAILGWTQILHRSPTAETLRQGISVLDRNARLQAQLIGDMLDMSSILLGKMRLEVQPVDLVTIVEAAIESVSPAAEARGVRVQCVCEPRVSPLLADPARLQQVLWNLLTNAVKFTPRGGRVQVVVARVNSHVEVVVTDTGRGIKSEFLPHVFERFRQADSSAAREHGGLGLGLALVKQLVELHGGTVAAESDGADKGATFRVSLPLAPVQPADQGSRVHPTAAALETRGWTAPDLRGLRVLVVDDDADARELLRYVLEGCGATVQLADCAAAALAALDGGAFDVIVSDIGMRGGDGYAFIGEVRRRGLRTPAAALTAFARAEDRTRALTAGYQMHVAKPVDAAELVAAVAALAQRLSPGERLPPG